MYVILLSLITTCFCNAAETKKEITTPFETSLQTTLARHSLSLSRKGAEALKNIKIAAGFMHHAQITLPQRILKVKDKTFQQALALTTKIIFSCPAHNVISAYKSRSTQLTDEESSFLENHGNDCENALTTLLRYMPKKRTGDALRKSFKILQQTLPDNAIQTIFNELGINTLADLLETLKETTSDHAKKT